MYRDKIRCNVMVPAFAMDKGGDCRHARYKGLWEPMLANLSMLEELYLVHLIRRHDEARTDRSALIPSLEKLRSAVIHFTDYSVRSL